MGSGARLDASGRQPGRFWEEGWTLLLWDQIVSPPRSLGGKGAVLGLNHGAQRPPQMPQHHHPMKQESQFSFLKVFFFLNGPVLKSLLNLSQHCLCFMFWFFGQEACGILTPWPGIEPAPPALAGEVLTIGPPGKPPRATFLLKLNSAHFPILCGLLDILPFHKFAALPTTENLGDMRENNCPHLMSKYINGQGMRRGRENRRGDWCNSNGKHISVLRQ